jgi:hypothetical protein
MMMNWKGFGRKWLWPNFKVLSQHSSGGNEGNHKKTSVIIAGCWGQDLNPGPPEHEAGVLTARPRRSVLYDVHSMLLQQ